MRFCDLLNLPYDSAANIDRDSLKRCLPDTPDDVLTQVYADHGRKDDFQSQYGELDITSLRWEKRDFSAAEIAASCHYDRFDNWIDGVEQRVAQFSAQGWACIDTRPNVVAHWREHMTWLRLPVFIAGHLIGAPTPLRLVEGHTRVGLLRGLIKAGVLATSSQHEIWLGQ